MRDFLLSSTISVIYVKPKEQRRILNSSQLTPTLIILKQFSVESVTWNISVLSACPLISSDLSGFWKRFLEWQNGNQNETQDQYDFKWPRVIVF